MIKVTNLVKTFNKNKNNEIKVINNTTFDLPETGLISFVGPSGAGKTTLLNVIGGLDKASGTINYNDELVLKKYDSKKLDEYRKVNFGYIFQNFNLLLDETIYDNLKIALEIINCFDEEEQEKRIKFALEAVKMWKFRKKKAKHLSGGQMQRIAIARALIKHSRVIIADEPTGNLDSKNTLMIMQILKEISKTRLVLMVTHNLEIARSFSDGILTIKDGEVLSNLKNEGKTYLNENPEEVLYLEDFKKDEFKSDALNLTYYHEGEAKKLNLRIIEVNHKLYLDSDLNLELLKDQNLKISEKRIQEEKGEEFTFNYDDSFFKNEKSKNKPFKALKTNLKRSFNNLDNLKRKTKFLYLSFFIIGILLAGSVLMLSNTLNIDLSNLESDEAYSVLKAEDMDSSKEKNLYLMEMLEKGYISDLNTLKYYDLSFYQKLNYAETIEFEVTAPSLAFKDFNEEKIIYGSKPKNPNEIVVSKGLAKKLLKESKGYFKTYEDLLKKNFSEVILVGITSDDTLMAYYEESFYHNLLINYNKNQTFTTDQVVFRNKEIEKKYDTYEVIKGRDLKENNYFEVLIPENYPNAFNWVDKEINLNGISYLCVGVYRFKGFTPLPKEVISNGVDSFYDSKDNYKMTSDDAVYKLVKGRMPKNDREILVSIYADEAYEVNGLEIVGYYNGDANTVSSMDLRSSNYYQLMESYGAVNLFRTLDEENLKKGLKDKFSLENHYEEVKNQKLAIERSKVGIFSLIGIVLLSFLTVFIYFLMRSKMIGDIYNIGVLRSLGASKGKIYRSYLVDIFITTSLTSVVGYLLVFILYSISAKEINNLLAFSNSSLNLTTNLLTSFLGLVLLYGLNLGFGILPIVSLCHKTPSEIISKYDI